MVKYLVACTAAIYCILILFGDESRRPEVTRQTQDEATGLSLAAFTPRDDVPTARALVSDISEAEAVSMAMAAGREYRATRKAEPLRGMIAALEASAAPDVEEAPEQAGDLWYVTGTRVNLRSGPGTANAVVGQLSLGDATEVLNDRNGWYEVRTADGALSGWIFGKFLAANAPG